MTAAQRLRLVLVLGVVNLVLASVALGIGISETVVPPIAVVQPTPGVPGVSTVPTPGGPGPSPAGPRPTPTPTDRPAPTAQPNTEPPPPEPTPLPSAEPSPSLEPSPVPSAVVALVDGPAPEPLTGGPIVGPTNPDAPAPSPVPSARTPVAGGGPPACHASARGIEASQGKACGTKRFDRPDKAHKHDKQPKATHRHEHRHERANGNAKDRRQQATVDPTRRGHTTRHRLRTGRRAR